MTGRLPAATPPALDSLDIVVPALNEAARIGALLRALSPARAAGARITVVDGGSSDDTATIAARDADRVLPSPAGRGRQLAAGCAAATREYLWLLHADSTIAPRHAWAVVDTLAQGAVWGRFDIRLDDPAPAFRAIGAAMNVRTRLTGIVTGDHGIFCRREALERAGGMPAQPLMEDIELSRRLRRLGWPACVGPVIGTSARRWQRRGVVRTVLSMWRFRLRYFFGASADGLAREYYGDGR